MMGGLGAIDGLPIYEDANLYKVNRKQVRFPRTKKRRIRNKWVRQEKNFEVWREPQAYWVQGKLYAHPSLVGDIKRLFRQTQSEVHEAFFGGF